MVKSLLVFATEMVELMMYLNHFPAKIASENARCVFLVQKESGFKMSSYTRPTYPGRLRMQTVALAPESSPSA